VYWFDTPVGTTQQLTDRLTREAARSPQPELHIRADARADYQAVGQVVYAAQQAGIVRVGFLTEPPQQ
jgi:biopolymer transport protein ExbD